MTFSILVRDDYNPAAKEIRERVLSGELSNYTGPHGEKYTNISRADASEFLAGLEEAVGFPVEISESGFRYDLKGEFPHNHAHADTVCAEYAAIVYLNLPEHCKGGTAFWQHTSGADSMPSNLPYDEEVSLVKDWSDAKKWRLKSLVGMKFNRLLVYPTSVFHSRYPHEGFGTGKQEGRLIWLAFFRRK